jgi:predicted metal-dependent phosphoesterase TrpH
MNGSIDMSVPRGHGLYDLHAHTTASDGVLTPVELVRLAKASGLRALAVTDHDTVAGVPEAVREASSLGIELVPGVEVSANFDGVPVHVLGLFVAYQEPWLVEFFEEAGKRRIDRVHEIVGKLAKLGVDIDAEEVFARSSHGTVGRPHVAAVLVDRGVVANLTEAFTRYLGDDAPAYVGYEKVSLEDAIALISRAGGVASLAHPYVLDNDGLIAAMAKRRLPALEVYHRDHTPEQIRTYEGLADELGLLATGGSDFHRPDGQGPELGCAQLSEEAFERLRAAAP